MISYKFPSPGLKMATTLGIFLTSMSLFSQTNVIKPNPTKADTSEYAILIFDRSDSWLFENAIPAILTSNDIDLIKNILEKAVELYNKNIGSDAFAIRPLKYYKMQFVSVINEKGEKKVWVNCLCHTSSKNLKKGILIVNDGGNCFFNVKINLTTKTFYQLAVNGDA